MAATTCLQHKNDVVLKASRWIHFNYADRMKHAFKLKTSEVLAQLDNLVQKEVNVFLLCSRIR